MCAVALDDDTERRDADQDGQVLRGLRWARNQGLHELVNLHRVAGGLTFPMTFPIRFSNNLVWLERSETAPNAWSNARNERAYDQFVARRSVEGTLRAAQRFLWDRAIPDRFVAQLPWDPSR